MRRALTTTGSTLSGLNARAFHVSTVSVESEGTLEWDATSVIVAEVSPGGATGLGYGMAIAPLWMCLRGP